MYVSMAELDLHIAQTQISRFREVCSIESQESCCLVSPAHREMYQPFWTPHFPNLETLRGRMTIKSGVSRIRPSGFTIVETMVVVAIVTIIASMTVTGLVTAKNNATRRSFVSSLYGQLVSARARALSRQRPQIIVLIAPPNSHATYGYYYFEEGDATTPPRVLSASSLSTLVSVLDPYQFTTSPVGYTLRLLDSSQMSTSPFYESSDAWNGAPLPFPWNRIPSTPTSPIITVGGCSFCSSGKGAVAFLPDGQAVFSDPSSNAAGGLVVISVTGSPSSTTLSAVGISPSGLSQVLER